MAYVSVSMFIYRYYNDYKESLSMVKISKILTWVEFRSEKMSIDGYALF